MLVRVSGWCVGLGARVDISIANRAQRFGAPLASHMKKIRFFGEENNVQSSFDRRDRRDHAVTCGDTRLSAVPGSGVRSVCVESQGKRSDGIVMNTRNTWWLAKTTSHSDTLSLFARLLVMHSAVLPRQLFRLCALFFWCVHRLLWLRGLVIFADAL